MQNRRITAKAGGAAVVSVALTLAMAGCNGGQGDSSSAAAGGELTIANWQFLEPNDQLWPVLSSYSTDHAGVTLKKAAIPYASYPSTIATQVGAHGGPDILVTVDNNFYQLAEAGAFEPLDGVLPKDEVSTLKGSNAQGRVNGSQLGYIWEPVVYDFFWNKKLLAAAGVQPPTNFQEFVAAAKAVKEKTDAYGFAARHLLNEEEAWYEDWTSTFLYGFNGSWTQDGKLTVDTPQNVQAVTAFKEMYDSGAMPIGDDASTFRSLFAQGKVAMMLDNQDAVYSMVGNNKVVASTDVGASAPPFPSKTTGNQLLFVSINKYSKHKDLAKKYLAWLFSQPVQQRLQDVVAPDTMGTNVSPSPSFAKANPWAPTFWAQLPHTRDILIEGHVAKTTQVGHAIMPEIARVLAGQQSPADALKRAQQAAQSVAGG
jgi:multiple sugar transport system substrate-binding protein